MKLKYSVVFERMPSNYGAYVPDLPGCISTGDTWQEVHEMIREAIAFHIEGLTEDGEPLPAPQLSISEAMAYHIENLSEVEESSPELETTFGMVEVEVGMPVAAEVS